MKNSSISNLVGILFLVATMVLFGACCDIDCRNNVLVKEEVKKLFPCEPGDQIRFISNSGDTLSFVCASREFVYIGESEEGEARQACCGDYTVENLIIKFEEQNSDIRIDNTNYFSSLYCRLLINDSTSVGGYWPNLFNAPYVEKLDEIQLAGKIFYNVYPPESSSQIYIEPDSLGIVGFISRGIEWRKL